MTRTAQRAFSGGIMSPGMYARRDINKWQTGLQDAVNVTLRAEGGVSNRAGTTFAGGFNIQLDGISAFMVPFEATEDDTYVLVFGEEVMYVMKQGAFVLDATTHNVVSETQTDPMTIELATGEALATVGRLFYVTDSSGSPLNGTIIRNAGNTGDFFDVDGNNGTALDNTSGDFDLGGSATLTEIYQITSPFTLADMEQVQFVQDVDTMIFVHPDYEPQSLVRVADDDWTFETARIGSEIEFPPSTNPMLGGATATAHVGTGSTTYSYQVAKVIASTGDEGPPTAAGDVECTNDLTVAGNINRISWGPVSPDTEWRLYKKFNGIYGLIYSGTSTQFDDENVTPDTSITPQVERDPFSPGPVYPGVAAFVDQRLTLAGGQGAPQQVDMSRSTHPFNFNRAASPGASDAIAFRIKSQKLNRVLHIVDANRPLVLTAGGEWYMDTGDDGGIAPGNFALRPKTYRGSAETPPPVLIGETLLHVTRSGSTLREFSLDLARDTASADLTLLARHLFKGKIIKSMAYAQEPDSIVWVTLTTGECYSLTYLEEHEVWGWTRHSFAGLDGDAHVEQVTVVTEGTRDVPYFMVVSGRAGANDGTHFIYRLDDRAFDNISECYFVDCGFKYRGLASTTSIDTFTGLLHLAGQDVVALADGAVVEGTVSSTGTLALGGDYYNVSVGLAYEASITTLDADFGDQIQEAGSSIGRYASPSEVAVKVVDTRGIATGSTESTFFNEVADYEDIDTYDLITDAVPPLSPGPGEPATVPVQKLATQTHNVNIEGDWGVDIGIIVKQAYPLPMTITAIAPTWTLGE